MNKEAKKQLRSEYRAKRAQIPIGEKCKRDAEIADKFLNSDIYGQSNEILCYVSTKDEIDTRGIIITALECGKKVFVPKCTEQKGVMRFYRINSFADLKAGNYGIFEPTNTNSDNEWKPSNCSTVCVAPALCCDKSGNRLGYGGGYYDRFLREFNGKVVCLCYSHFSDVDLPVEAHDVPCDEVIKA